MRMYGLTSKGREEHLAKTNCQLYQMIWKRDRKLGSTSINVNTNHSQELITRMFLVNEGK